MNREGAIWVGVSVVAVAIGLMLARHSWLPPPETGAEPFRRWFWEVRGLDLLAQVGLILAGALGIAALLPRDKEDEAT